MTCHYPDLRSVSDWLEFSHNQSEGLDYKDLGSDTSSVWNFCARYSERRFARTSATIWSAKLLSRSETGIKIEVHKRNLFVIDTDTRKACVSEITKNNVRSFSEIEQMVVSVKGIILLPNYRQRTTS